MSCPTTRSPASPLGTEGVLVIASCSPAACWGAGAAGAVGADVGTALGAGLAVRESLPLVLVTLLGMTGVVLRELRRRQKKYGIVSMCIGKGMGAAGLFEFVH